MASVSVAQKKAPIPEKIAEGMGFVSGPNNPNDDARKFYQNSLLPLLMGADRLNVADIDQRTAQAGKIYKDNEGFFSGNRLARNYYNEAVGRLVYLKIEKGGIPTPSQRDAFLEHLSNDCASYPSKRLESLCKAVKTLDADGSLLAQKAVENMNEQIRLYRKGERLVKQIDDCAPGFAKEYADWKKERILRMSAKESSWYREIEMAASLESHLYVALLAEREGGALGRIKSDVERICSMGKEEIDKIGGGRRLGLPKAALETMLSIAKKQLEAPNQAEVWGKIKEECEGLILQIDGALLMKGYAIPAMGHTGIDISNSIPIPLRKEKIDAKKRSKKD